MKRILSLTLCVIMLVLNMNITVYADEQGPDILSEAVILMEASTGKVIYEKNADESLYPASITKIMTLLLIFDEIKAGKLSMEDQVTVSEHAASMGGSQVFLEPGETQNVNTMIKCISVASANDASVAMAEHIAGSEDAFVERMNAKAKELGMTNTNFVNCCGLDEDNHKTTARDVALMSKELIVKHPEVHNYSTIWMDTITHVTRKGETVFELSNTNKLIKQYQWATGLKTGSTSKAKCCLSATAKRNNIELIAVVMAAPNSKTRFSDAITLLNYGYSMCHQYKSGLLSETNRVPVIKGKEEFVEVKEASEFSYMFLEPYDSDKITKELVLPQELTAPVEQGTTVGRLVFYYDGREIGYTPMIACQKVEEATFWEMLTGTLSRWLIQ